ncbi:MAG: N-formylglutamate amidohydrolase [Alphaproteobacteria bacterium]|nr:N-formylglutamate amidohydrolase [Alphaproteobacteria bacterium]
MISSPFGVVLSCEHASARTPPGLDLGVPASHLGHEVWDPGALDVAQALALRLAAPLLSGQVNRLVCDLHRRETHPEVTRADAWGLAVPGNAGLSPQARAARLAAFHAPFRRALRAEVDRAIGLHSACAHVSVHSFTPHLPHGERDLDVGVLFRPDRAFATAVGDALLAALAQAGFDARLNQPYQGVGEATTTWLEEQLPDRRYAGVEIELSQRLDDVALARVVEALAYALS